MGQDFGECPIFNPNFIGFEETSGYWSIHFFLVFLCFPLVTINRQTSFDSGILRQDHGIIRGSLMDYTMSSRLCARLGGLPERTEVGGLITALD